MKNTFDLYTLCNLFKSMSDEEKINFFKNGFLKNIFETKSFKFIKNNNKFFENNLFDKKIFEIIIYIKRDELLRIIKENPDFFFLNLINSPQIQEDISIIFSERKEKKLINYTKFLYYSLINDKYPKDTISIFLNELFKIDIKLYEEIINQFIVIDKDIERQIIPQWYNTIQHIDIELILKNRIETSMPILFEKIIEYVFTSKKFDILNAIDFNVFQESLKNSNFFDKNKSSLINLYENLLKMEPSSQKSLLIEKCDKLSNPIIYNKGHNLINNNSKDDIIYRIIQLDMNINELLKNKNNKISMSDIDYFEKELKYIVSIKNSNNVLNKDDMSEHYISLIKKYIKIYFLFNTKEENNILSLNQNGFLEFKKCLENSDVKNLINSVIEYKVVKYIDVTEIVDFQNLINLDKYISKYTPEYLEKTLSNNTYENIIIGKFLQESMFYNMMNKIKHEYSETEIDTIIKKMHETNDFAIQSGGGLDKIINADVFQKCFLLEFKRDLSEFSTELEKKNLIFGINLTHIFCNDICIHLIKNYKSYSFETSKKYINQFISYFNRVFTDKNGVDFSELYAKLKKDENNSNSNINTPQIIKQKKHYIITRNKEKYYYEDYFEYFLLKYDNPKNDSMLIVDNSSILENKIKQNILNQEMDIFVYLSNLSQFGFFADISNNTLLVGKEGSSAGETLLSLLNQDDNKGSGRNFIDMEKEVAISKIISENKKIISRKQTPEIRQERQL